MGTELTRKQAAAVIRNRRNFGYSPDLIFYTLQELYGFGIRPAVVARYYRALDHKAGIKRPLFRRRA